jgi:predicted metal-dependent phosphoesterase TrpH
LQVTADLHTHSSASDGDLNPSQLVELAASKGLTAISLTDHDTLTGIPMALESGSRHAVDVITGVEISAEYEPGMLHILGYFPVFPDGMEVDLARVQAARRERIPRIVRKLNDLGVMLTEEDIIELAGEAQIGRPHIAKVLLNEGYVSSFDEAFDEYLGKGKKAYVPKEKMTCEKAIGLIRNYRGLPVLAHPYTLHLEDADLKSFIKELRQWGLVGIEVYYPDHTPDDTTRYLHMAQEFGLLITGGTDFHGADRKTVSLGDHGIDSTLLKSFCEHLKGPHTT